jgi:hypothetical protein
VCPDWTGPPGEDPDDGSPADRPYGTKPYGTKPYGTKPYGTKPYGTKPYGTKPYGTKPYGTKPYGTKPYGTKSDDPDFLDPDEWSGDVAGLFCDYSALVRLSARLIAGGDDVQVPAVEFANAGAAYVQQPVVTPPTAPQGKSQFNKAKPEARVSQRQLQPRAHELAVTVVIPNRLVRDLVDSPDIAWALKEDIAKELAFQADKAFLQGPGGPVPLGITANGAIGVQAAIPPPGAAAGADLLAMARAMIAALRVPPAAGPPTTPAVFRNPGWVLSPGALAGLAGIVTQDGSADQGPGAGARTVDNTRLLVSDGRDGGEFLGFPFIATVAASSANAPERMFLSSDWSEAWIGTDRDLVTIDISTDTRFRDDETVVRVVMYHDFVVRRPAYFLRT